MILTCWIDICKPFFEKSRQGKRRIMHPLSPASMENVLKSTSRPGGSHAVLLAKGLVFVESLPSLQVDNIQVNICLALEPAPMAPVRLVWTRGTRHSIVIRRAIFHAFCLCSFLWIHPRKHLVPTHQAQAPFPNGRPRDPAGAPASPLARARGARAGRG